MHTTLVFTWICIRLTPCVWINPDLTLLFLLLGKYFFFFLFLTHLAIKKQIGGERDRRSRQLSQGEGRASRKRREHTRLYDAEHEGALVIAEEAAYASWTSWRKQTSPGIMSGIPQWARDSAPRNPQNPPKLASFASGGKSAIVRLAGPDFLCGNKRSMRSFTRATASLTACTQSCAASTGVGKPSRPARESSLFTTSAGMLRRVAI